jgi:hypothetical protein
MSHTHRIVGVTIGSVGGLFVAGASPRYALAALIIGLILFLLAQLTRASGS